MFKSFGYILILIIFFSFIQSKIKIQDIKLKNEIKLEDLTETQYFHAIPDFENNLPNYLKIEVYIQDSYHITEDDIVIAYYQHDSNFKDRKLLSRNGTVIWLNKEQIEKGFYFSIESFYSETTYDINIYAKDIITLELDQQYIYYVIDENKEMKFRLCGDIGWDTEGKNGMLSIWAKGNKDIITELSEKNNYKHQKYNAYLIKLNNVIFYEYNLIVKGNVGDIINVGQQFFDENYNTTYIEFGIEQYGFLKKNIFEKVCFKVDYSSHNFYGYIYEEQELKILKKENDEDEDDDDYYMDKKYCISLNNDFENYDEIFYSVQAIKNEDIYENGKINIPQKLGINYEREIKEKSIIGIIPLKTYDDFNFMTYHIQEKRGIIKASIYKCYTYPNCKIDTLKDEIVLKNFNSYSFSFTNNEYGKIITPFTQKQNILLLSCEKGTPKNEIENTCSVIVNMHTDKNKFKIIPQIPFYKYIREKNEDNLLINHSILVEKVENNEKVQIYLNIEIISGNATIILGNKEPYKYKNKLLYIFDYDKGIEYLLNIKANINTVYSVVVNYNIPSIEKMLSIPIGSNYLFKIDNILNDYNFKISNTENKYISTGFEPSYFFGFYPINCKIEVKNKNNNLKEKNGFYQDIIINNEEKNDLIYNISKVDKNTNECLLEISSFIFEDLENIDYINGINLSFNISKSFLFDKDNKKLIFLFTHSEKEKDLKINFKLLDEEKYDLSIFFMDSMHEIKYSILNTNSILIKSQDLQYLCMNYNQVCKINFVVESHNILEESILEIIITNDDNNDHNDNNDKNEPNSKDLNNLDDTGNSVVLYTLVTILVIISIITIILLVILLFRCKNKKKSFNDEIDKLTYLNDKKNTISDN